MKIAIIYIFCICPFTAIRGFSIGSGTNPIDNIIQHIPKIPFHAIHIDKFTQISIENKLHLSFISYYVRKIFHTIGFSQQLIIHAFNDLEWSEIDYFNIFIFITAMYSFYKNIENKHKMDKITSIIEKEHIRKQSIILFVILTVLFRDMDNAI